MDPGFRTRGQPGSDRIALYINGAQVASVASSDALANLRDVGNWLGRWHLSGDPAFSGVWPSCGSTAAR